MLDRKELLTIMTELAKITKTEKSQDYRNGYTDGVLDFYNRMMHQDDITKQVKSAAGLSVG